MSEGTSAATWVRFLRNYGPIPTNDNMYDESIQRALKRHKIAPIALPAQFLADLLINFKSDSPLSQIITGTAGDGKTYHCREVWAALGGDAEVWNQGSKIQRLDLGGRTLVIVKDLSELKDDEGASLVETVARDVADPAAKTFYLLAANHGQLLEKLKTSPQTAAVKRFARVVEDLLVTGKSADIEVRLQLKDLSRAPAAKMTADIIEAITKHDGWTGCTSCPSQSGDLMCPILENRRRLMAEGEGDPFQRRLTELVELSERNGGHFPVRQLLALIANSLLGHPEARDGLMSCTDVPAIQSTGRADLASVYRNIFGENLKPSRAEKTELFKKLNLFGIGSETSNRVDNLLVYASSVLLEQANSYADLLRNLNIHAAGDINRRDLWELVLAIGTVQVTGGAPSAIVAPWHPMRLAGTAVKMRSLTGLIDYLLSDVEVNFGDSRLFFSDLREELAHPLYPEIAVGYDGTEPVLLAETGTANDYSLLERPVRDPSEASTDVDPAEAARQIRGLIERYLDLQPHEGSNLSIMLYNCDAAGLPLATVNALSSVQDQDEVHCNVLVRHRDRSRLGHVYGELLDRSDGDPDAVVVSETSRNFMSKLRIGVMLDSGNPGGDGTTREIDVAFLHDVVSRQAKEAWFSVPAVNGRVKMSQRASQNVATLGLARLPRKRAPASGRPRLSQSWRLPGCFGP